MSNTQMSVFYFEVDFKGETTSFLEASGLLTDLNEPVDDKGDQKYSHHVPVAALQSNLILKRGLCVSGSAFADWCSDTLNLKIPVRAKNLSVRLINADGCVFKRWRVLKAFPVGMKAGNLVSQQDGFLMESVELAYGQIEEGL